MDSEMLINIIHGTVHYSWIAKMQNSIIQNEPALSMDR